MAFQVNADLVGLVRGLVNSIRPFAQAQDVDLSFQSQGSSLNACYNPEELVPDLTKLISRIVTFTPQSFAVEVKVSPGEKAGEAFLSISNSGVNLARMQEILSGIGLTMEITGDETTTCFRLRLPIASVERDGETTPSADLSPPDIYPFYAEIRKRLTSHFKSVANLETAAFQKSPREGVFLKKVDAVILSQLEESEFSVESLAKALAVSKIQLFRKIKNLTGRSPGRYIQFVRLQKAKELLESDNLNVSEVAYRTGFISPSHFTRAFQKQFGFRPSDLKK